MKAEKIDLFRDNLPVDCADFCEVLPRETLAEFLQTLQPGAIWEDGLNVQRGYGPVNRDVLIRGLTAWIDDNLEHLIRQYPRDTSVLGILAGMLMDYLNDQDGPPVWF